jgi:hypothetical protein
MSIALGSPSYIRALPLSGNARERSILGQARSDDRRVG